MPLNLNFTHIMVVLVVALIVLGPDKLPDAARSVARVIGELRKMSNGLKDEVRNTFGEYADPFTDLVGTITGSVNALGSTEVKHPAPAATGGGSALAAPAAAEPGDEGPAPPLISLPSLAPSLPSLGAGSGLVSKGPTLAALTSLPSLGQGPPLPGTFAAQDPSIARPGIANGVSHGAGGPGGFAPGPPGPPGPSGAAATLSESDDRQASAGGSVAH